MLRSKVEKLKKQIKMNLQSNNDIFLVFMDKEHNKVIVEKETKVILRGNIEEYKKFYEQNKGNSFVIMDWGLYGVEEENWISPAI